MSLSSSVLVLSDVLVPSMCMYSMSVVWAAFDVLRDLLEGSWNGL